ncbi:MAG: DUF5668 domain-containing protein [Patescibacteria group bacterium]
METQKTHAQSINLGKLFLGLLLVFAGLIYFARAAGFLPNYMGMHPTQLWPVLLIFIGLSLIRVRGGLAVTLGILLTILILSVSVYAMFRGQYQPINHMMFGFEDEIKKELPWFADRPCGQNATPDENSWPNGIEGWRMYER